MKPTRYTFKLHDQWVIATSIRHRPRVRAIEFEPDTGAVYVEVPDLGASFDEGDLTPPIHRIRLTLEQYEPCDHDSFVLATTGRLGSVA